MNFTINLSDLENIPMSNVLLYALIVLLCIIAWRLPELIEQYRKIRQDRD